jgi:hypothetical protein
VWKIKVINENVFAISLPLEKSGSKYSEGKNVKIRSAYHLALSIMRGEKGRNWIQTNGGGGEPSPWASLPEPSKY